MPTISGFVYYTPNNTLTPNIGVPNVPIVLYNVGALIGAVALTDVNGAYVFNNVPAGNFQVIEAWGASGGSASPVDFTTAATSMPTPPAEAEPPLSALPVTPPALADMLMAISPNLLNITVAAVDIANLDFYDAPVGSKPVVFNGINMIGGNLITAADNGSFGTVPAGSPVNTIPAIAPYPTATPGLPYVAAPEIPDGSYSIVNIRRKVNTGYEWWNLSDHETMLETGRFMFVNGDQPGAILFTDTVNVTPNTNYTLTGWGLNLLDVEGTPPRFAVEVLGADGSQLGFQLFNSLLTTIIPVWYQAGFLFNSAANPTITVRVLSEAPFSPVGNDYAIDELRLFEANIIDLLSLQKSITPSTIYSNTSGVGQEATVSVVVSNTSDITAPNVFFQDTIDPRLQFVTGSVTVNGSGTGFETANPNTGFSLGNLEAGAINTVQFKVTSVVPGPTVIPNTANATYDAATNGNGDVIRNTVDSNEADLAIVINQAQLTINKSVDKTNATTGDVLTYTLAIQNTGNVSANNVVLTDAIPAGTTFVPNSVTGATGTPPTLTLANPVAAGGTASISFQVKVNDTLPTPNPIQNNATANFTYTVDPANPNGASGNAESNLVETQVNEAILTMNKSVAPTYSDVDGILTYTIIINNEGNVSANNVILTDAVPAGTTFVPNSVTGATGTPPTLTLANPIDAGMSATVTFQVKVDDTLPTPNPVLNTATANFTYTVDPQNPNGASGNATSNTASAQVNHAEITTMKMVDKAIANTGDVLTYTLVLQNTGNTAANTVVINDVLPAGTTFIPGSLIGATGTPPTLTLTNPIAAGTSTTITFQVQVGAMLPQPNPLSNSATTSFNYTIDPAIPNGGSGTSDSNVVTTQINHAEIITTKTVDKPFADINDVVTYTINLQNTGNVSANNVTLNDVIPAGTTYVAGSLTGASGTLPNVTLVTPIGAGETSTITFKVKVNGSVPMINPLINTANVSFQYTVDPTNPNGANGTSRSEPVSTQVNNATLTIIKSTDKTISYLNDTITYQLVVKNTGNVPADQVVISDAIVNGLNYVPNSAIVNVPFTGNPVTGITLTNPIAPGQTVNISFQTKVIAMPVPNPLENVANIAYAYTVDPSAPDAVEVTKNSNEVITIVFRNNYEQQINDIIESVALEEAALAALANAEGAKIQKAVSLGNITNQELLCINKSVEELLSSLALLEAVLKQKISVVSCQIDGDAC